MTDSAHSGYTLSGLLRPSEVARLRNSLRRPPHRDSTTSRTPRADRRHAGQGRHHRDRRERLTRTGSSAAGRSTTASGVPDISDNSTITVTLSNLRGTASTCGDVEPSAVLGPGNMYPGPARLQRRRHLLERAAERGAALVGASAAVSVHVAQELVGHQRQLRRSGSTSVRRSTVTMWPVHVAPVARADLDRERTGWDQAASFNIFGQVSIPRNDLEHQVEWPGPSRRLMGTQWPLGGGNMILSGLKTIGLGSTSSLLADQTRGTDRDAHRHRQAGGRDVSGPWHRTVSTSAASRTTAPLTVEDFWDDEPAIRECHLTCIQTSNPCCRLYLE